MSKLRAAAQREWVIWSIEHKVWWKPNRCGYTPDIAKAGRYSFQEAQDICLTRSGGAQIDEVMVPAPEAVAALTAQGEPPRKLTAKEFLEQKGVYPEVRVLTSQSLVSAEYDTYETVANLLEAYASLVSPEPPQRDAGVTLAPPIDPSLTDEDVFGGPIEDEQEPPSAGKE